MSSNGRGAGRGLSTVPREEDSDMPGDPWLTNGSGWEPWEVVVADRARRTVEFLVIGGRGRSLKVLAEAAVDIEGLRCPSLPAAGNFLELRRAGTGIGGAMTDALLPLSVLGSLRLCVRVRWCAAAPLVIMAARRIS